MSASGSVHRDWLGSAWVFLFLGFGVSFHLLGFHFADWVFSPSLSVFQLAVWVFFFLVFGVSLLFHHCHGPNGGGRVAESPID